MPALRPSATRRSMMARTTESGGKARGGPCAVSASAHGHARASGTGPGELVRGDLQLVSVGVGEVERVRGGVVLEARRDAVRRQVVARPVERRAVDAEG